MRRLPALLVPSVVFLIALTTQAQACPGCIESVQVADSHPAEVLAGFSLSVLFMLAAVLVVVGGLTSLVVRAAREIEEARSLVPIPADDRNQDRPQGSR